MDRDMVWLSRKLNAPHSELTASYLHISVIWNSVQQNVAAEMSLSNGLILVATSIQTVPRDFQMPTFCLGNLIRSRRNKQNQEQPIISIL